MIDQEKTNSAPGTGISEAQRMAKIRELLVGPVIADESARVDQSFGRLDELVRQQQQTITALQARIQELEERHHAGMKRLQVRLLGMVETLLADEDDLRSRLMQSETLQPKLENDDGNGSS